MHFLVWFLLIFLLVFDLPYQLLLFLFVLFLLLSLIIGLKVVHIFGLWLHYCSRVYFLFYRANFQKFWSIGLYSYFVQLLSGFHFLWKSWRVRLLILVLNLCSRIMVSNGGSCPDSVTVLSSLIYFFFVMTFVALEWCLSISKKKSNFHLNCYHKLFFSS